MADEQRNGFWAVVEIFGHKRFAGFVSEWLFAGDNFVRIDVPETARDKAFSKMFGAKAVYGMSPCDEATARAYAEALRERPLDVALTSLQPALPASHVDDDDDPADYGEGYDGQDDDLDDEAVDKTIAHAIASTQSCDSHLVVAKLELYLGSPSGWSWDSEVRKIRFNDGMVEKIAFFELIEDDGDGRCWYDELVRTRDDGVFDPRIPKLVERANRSTLQRVLARMGPSADELAKQMRQSVRDLTEAQREIVDNPVPDPDPNDVPF